MCVTKTSGAISELEFVDDYDSFKIVKPIPSEPFRCCSCNSVSNPKLNTPTSPYKKTIWVEFKSDLFCGECFESIETALIENNLDQMSESMDTDENLSHLLADEFFLLYGGWSQPEGESPPAASYGRNRGILIEEDDTEDERDE